MAKKNENCVTWEQLWAGICVILILLVTAVLGYAAGKESTSSICIKLDDAGVLRDATSAYFKCKEVLK